MINHCRIIAGLLLTSLCAFSAYAQSEGSDTSAAQAAIQSLQASSQNPSKLTQAFPALKAQSCKSAVAYVESPSGLLGDWDSTMLRYKGDKGGLEIFQKAKAELLSDSYWRVGPLATIALNVRTICKITNDVLGTISPGGNEIGMAIKVSEDFGAEVSRRSVQIYQALENADEVLGLLKSNTNELTLWGAKEAAQQAGYGRAVKIVDVLQDVADHMKTSDEAIKYQVVVQQALQNLDIGINKNEYDMLLQRQQLVAVEAQKDAVIAACNSGEPTQGPPVFLNTEPPQTVQNASSEQDVQSQPALPWWANIGTIRIPTSTFRGGSATRTVYGQQICPGDQGMDTGSTPIPAGCPQPPTPTCDGHPITATTKSCR
jgi:hypothetical protein